MFRNLKFKVKLSPAQNIEFDKKTGEFYVKAIPGRCKLLLEDSDISKLQPGWYLIHGSFDRNGKNEKFKIIYKVNHEFVEETLPITCKGTLLELIKIPENTEAIYIEPLQSKGSFKLKKELTLKPVSYLELVFRMLRRVLSYYHIKYKDQRKKLGLFWYSPFVSLHKSYKLVNIIRDCSSENDYSKWVKLVDSISKNDIKKILKDIEKSKLKVRFLLVLTKKDPEEKLATTFNSLNRQLYKNFRIIDLNKLSEYIKNSVYRDEYVIFLKPGILLKEYCLYWLAKEALNSEAEFIYTDHDYINHKGERVAPWFKPDFSLEYLRSMNYIDHAFAVKIDVLRRLKSISIDDIQDYNTHNLLFKIIEHLDITKIKHIPAILFHIPEVFNKKKAYKNDLNPVKEHLTRLQIKGNVSVITDNAYKVIYSPQTNPLISIIIPTRDKYFLLKNCIQSVLNKTRYENYEIIVVNNQSSDRDTLRYLKDISSLEKIKVIEYDKPFNFSAINNHAVKIARGEVLVFLNNDTEVISSDWLEIMLGCLEQSRVGVVGAKLYYKNETIQHAGVVIGPGGCADHAFKGLCRNECGYMNRAIVMQEYSAVTAACLMTWKKLFFEVGGFDEINLPVSFNDVDYCLKIRERGYRVIFTPYAELYHYESQSRGRNFAREKKEADFIRKKWGKYIEHDPFYNPNLNYKKPDFTLNFFPKLSYPWQE